MTRTYAFAAQAVCSQHVLAGKEFERGRVRECARRLFYHVFPDLIPFKPVTAEFSYCGLSPERAW